MSEMREVEQKLLEGAKRLEYTTYGVLHEDYLKRHMAPQHWASLTTALVREVPFFCIKQSQSMLAILSANGSEVPPAHIFLESIASFGYWARKGVNRKLCQMTVV